MGAAIDQRPATAMQAHHHPTILGITKGMVAPYL
jgi:hypothetical protein